MPLHMLIMIEIAATTHPQREGRRINFDQVYLLAKLEAQSSSEAGICIGVAGVRCW